MLDDQKGPDLSKICPEMTKRLAKYVKIKVFDTWMKIESLVLTGNDYFNVSLYFV